MPTNRCVTAVLVQYELSSMTSFCLYLQQIVTSQQFVQTIQSQQDSQRHTQNVVNQFQQQVPTTVSHLQRLSSLNQVQLVVTKQQSPIKPKRTPLLRPLRAKPSPEGTQINSQLLQFGQQNLQITQLPNGQLTLTPQPTQQQCILLQALQQPQTITLQTVGNVHGIPQTITLPIQGQTIGQQLFGPNIFIQTPQLFQTVQPGLAHQNPPILLTNNGGVQISQMQGLNNTSQEGRIANTNAIKTIPNATTIGGHHTEKISEMDSETLDNKEQVTGEFNSKSGTRNMETFDQQTVHAMDLCGFDVT